MYVIGTSRYSLIKHLPKGGRAIEIGVFRGGFSQILLKYMQPSELHLVDPWITHDDEEYKADPANANADIHGNHYRDVCDKFAAEIASGVVKLHRTTSLEAATTFPDEYFDFIYIDAMHYHAAVLKDLQAFGKKLKKGGILAGHDYAEHRLAAKMNFGVISAVTTFLQRSDFKFMLLSALESDAYQFPSYFLSNQSEPPWLNKLLCDCFENKISVLGVPDAIASHFYHKILINAEGKEVYIPTMS